MWKTGMVSLSAVAFVLTTSTLVSAEPLPPVVLGDIGPGQAPDDSALGMYDYDRGFFISMGDFRWGRANPGIPYMLHSDPGIWTWYLESTHPDGILYDEFDGIGYEDNDGKWIAQGRPTQEAVATRERLTQLYDDVVRSRHPLELLGIPGLVAEGPIVSTNEFRFGLSSMDDRKWGTQSFTNFWTGPIIDPEKLAASLAPDGFYGQQGIRDLNWYTVDEFFTLKAEGGSDRDGSTVPRFVFSVEMNFPEPGMLTMLLSGGLGLGLWGWRRRKRA